MSQVYLDIGLLIYGIKHESSALEKVLNPIGKWVVQLTTIMTLLYCRHIFPDMLV